MHSALVDEDVDIGGHPGQFGHARTDLLVKAPDPLLEQSALLEVEAQQDAVVVSHHQQNVLPQHSESLALLVDFGSVVRHFKPQPLPVEHLVEEADEVASEVGTDYATASPERRENKIAMARLVNGSPPFHGSSCYYTNPPNSTLNEMIKGGGGGIKEDNL